MKVIDLLNKIANREDVPKRIKYDNKIWELDKNINEYYRHTGTISRWLFNEYTRTRNINCFLNDEIEIIEDTPKEVQVLSRWYPPKEDKKIKRLGKCFFTDYDDMFTEWVATYNGVIVDKLNEIIDKVNGGVNE